MEKSEHKPTIYYELQSDFKLLRAFRESVANYLQKKGIPTNTMNDILIALNEALSNTIEHAYEFDKSKPIIIKIYEQKDGIIEFVVRDFGKQISDKSILNMPEPELKKRGLGIYIMRNVMDKIWFADVERGNELHLVKKIE